MNTLSNRSFLIFGAVLVIVLIVVVIGFLLVNRKPTTPSVTTSVTPTKSSVAPTNNISQSAQPTVNIEPRFTGGDQGNLTQPQIDASKQRTELINKTPVKFLGFTVEYSYADDIFTVTLQQPVAENRQNFENWLKQNYPALSVDRFTFK